MIIQVKTPSLLIVENRLEMCFERILIDGVYDGLTDALKENIEMLTRESLLIRKHGLENRLLVEIY